MMIPLNAPRQASARSARRLVLLAATFALAIATPPRESPAEEQGEAAESESASKYAFEWGGVYALPQGVTDLVTQPGPDASIDIALVPVANDSEAAFDAAVAEAVRVFAGQPEPVQPGEEFSPGARFHQLRVEGASEMRFPVRVATAGLYALFTQHFADEFQTIFVTGGQRTASPPSRDFGPALRAPARIAFDAERMAHIGSPVAGRVSALPVRQGDEVKVGDALVVLDSVELGQLQSEFLRRRTALDTTAPAVELALEAYERARKLQAESQGVSLTEVQRRRWEHQAAVAAMKSAEAELSETANRLRLLAMSDAEIASMSQEEMVRPRFVVRSPIAGRIMRRDVTLGESVHPDRGPLLIVADTSKLWVLADVPEMRIAGIAVGSAVRLTLTSLPSGSFEGVVAFISNDFNEATRTLQVRVEVDNADRRLRPGMFAQAEIRRVTASAPRVGAPGEPGRVSVVGGRKIFPQASRNFRDRFGQIVIQPSALSAFGVRVENTGARTLEPSFSAPARVAFNAERIAQVGSAVEGRVTVLAVRQGEDVNEGDTLAVVESPELGELQSDYLRALSATRTARPLVDLAKDAHGQARKLYEETQGVSLTEVQKRQGEVQSASAVLRSAEAKLSDAANRLRLHAMTEAEIATLAETGNLAPRYLVRSPIAGRVIRRDVTLGESVGPDRDALLVVADMTKLWVLVDVAESRLGEITLGSAVRLAPATMPGSAIEGEVSLISEDINEATRTVQIRVEVENADGRLRPGMFVEAEVKSRGETLLAVPEAAVQTIEGKTVVFVPFTEKPNTFLKRPVTVGEPVGGFVPVLHGVREGEPIVVSGSFILKAELGKSTAKHAH